MRRLERGISIPGLGDDLDPADSVKDADETATHQLVVIAEQHPDHGLIGHALHSTALSGLIRTIGAQGRDLLL